MKIVLVVISSIISFLLISCSNDADPQPDLTHPAGWMEKGSANFHGRKDLTIGSDFCTPCHGEDYAGGSSGVACSDCHNEYPHPDTWAAPGDNNNHAAFIRAKYWSMALCKTCHGSDYKGGLSKMTNQEGLRLVMSVTGQILHLSPILAAGHHLKIYMIIRILLFLVSELINPI